jgi:hypothetical protein
MSDDTTSDDTTKITGIFAPFFRLTGTVIGFL